MFKLLCYLLIIYFLYIIFQAISNIKNYHEYEEITSGEPMLGIGNLRHNHY